MCLLNYCKQENVITKVTVILILIVQFILSNILATLKAQEVVFYIKRQKPN